MVKKVTDCSRSNSLWKNQLILVSFMVSALASSGTAFAMPFKDSNDQFMRHGSPTGDQKNQAVQCDMNIYSKVLSFCVGECGEGKRPCIHVCCHNRCNVECSAGSSGYWDCHRQCEEWRDPGATEGAFGKAVSPRN